MILANGGFYILPNYLSDKFHKALQIIKQTLYVAFLTNLKTALQIKYTFVCGYLFFSNIGNYYLRLGQTKFWH